MARFGRLVEADLEQATEGKKNQQQAKMAAGMVLAKWLGNEARGGFRTPEATR